MTSKVTRKAEPLLRVRCAECGWEWIAAYLPLPIRDACKIMMSTHCPKCAAPPKRILACWNVDNPPQPTRAPPP